MGDTGQESRRSGLQVDDSCRLPKKGKKGGGVDISQVAKFAIWDWVGDGVGMSQVANGARFVI